MINEPYKIKFKRMKNIINLDNIMCIEVLNDAFCDKINNLNQKREVNSATICTMFFPTNHE